MDHVAHESPTLDLGPPSVPEASQPAGATHILITNREVPSTRPLIGQPDEREDTQPFTGTCDETIAQGFSPCGHCNP
ncbi:MAG TPA: hypothetical protein K8U80_04980 [Collinsella ihuae]|uniref:Uncharacterized protein n=1 Tax=Collinsella ihumii TaxID=1720204 RepID=A0A921LQ87_9ACTN|nr:hypothetical protein [Collinsella ihumii]